MTEHNTVNAALVIGGGVAGQRAALDIAEAGYPVYLVERSASLGGIVAQLGFMFPSHDCVLCIGGRDHGQGCTRPAISPQLHEKSRHPNITVLTSTEITSVEGEVGNFSVQVKQRPTYVDPARCINCGKCAEVCPIDVPSAYHEGLAPQKLIDKSAGRTIPDSYSLWEKVEYCETCKKCVEACPTDAVNLDAAGNEQTLHVGAIVLTAGYRLFDPNQYEEYGHGRFPAVLTSLEFERLVSNNGPLQGHFTVPGTDQKPAKIAWLQCIGSREEKHPWCSSICCMHATKEAILAKERIGDDVECSIFLMDQRTYSKEYHAYYQRSREMYGIEYVRSRISNLRQDPATRQIYLRWMDEAGALQEEPYDVVVLSVGVHPPAGSENVAAMLGVDLSAHGFCQTGKFTPEQTSRPGVFAAGSIVQPGEMAQSFSEASAAANEVIQLLKTAGSPNVPATPREQAIPAPEGPARVGVFVCTCGGTLDSQIDAMDIAAFAGSLPDVAYATGISLACLDEGQDEIAKAIQTHGLNRLVVAACTERTHLSLFEQIGASAGIPRGLTTMANIREQCAWVHPDRAVATTKAQELVRMAVSRAISGQPVQMETVAPAASALVLGGGISGMTSALEMANAGLDVTLIEKTDALGGMVRRKHLLAEGLDPQAYLANLIDEVSSHERIRVMMRTQLVTQSGRPGRFRSILSQGSGNGAGPEEITLEHGVTIVAIGGQPYAGDEYMLGQSPVAVSQLELERILAEEPERAAGWNEVVMIQCVGRDETEGSPCSAICCTGAVGNALKVKELNPACNVYVLYRDVMTYGHRETYYTAAREKGVIFVRYDPEEKPQVSENGAGLVVTIRERTLGETLNLKPDLLALSTVTRPADDVADVAWRLGVPTSPAGFFQEQHIKMRPTQFARRGIFVAGLAHYPKFIEDSVTQAKAVAAQAMQLVGRGDIQVGGLVAHVDQDKCVGCLTCVRICPYDAPYIDGEVAGVGAIIGAAYIDPARCQGCGLCTAECPAKAIELAGYEDSVYMNAGMPILGARQSSPQAR